VLRKFRVIDVRDIQVRLYWNIYLWLYFSTIWWVW
jgi:hypothetical protein